VVLEADGRTVRKTFHGGTPDGRRRSADEELFRMARFRAALPEGAGVTCPRPRGPVDTPDPGLRMSWIAGEPLIEYLARRVLRDDEIARLASIIATGLRTYIDAVGEPYHDFKLDNMLVEPSGAVAFVDFGLPDRHVPPDPGHSPYEVSMGSLLGSLVFESARPKQLVRRLLHRQSAAVAVALVVELRDGGATLRGDHLSAAARRTYVRSTFGRCSRAHSAWYATVGRTAGYRVRLPEGRFGPVGRGAASAVTSPPTLRSS